MRPGPGKRSLRLVLACLPRARSRAARFGGPEAPARFLASVECLGFPTPESLPLGRPGPGWLAPRGRVSRGPQGLERLERVSRERQGPERPERLGRV